MQSSESVINTILRNSPKRGHLTIRKADRFFAPSSTWTIQSSLDNVDTGIPLTQDCLAPLVDSPTGQYNSTGTHSTSLWLVFLTSVQQGKGLERSAQWHKYTLPHLLAEASIVGTPLYSGRFRWHQRCPHYGGSTVARVM